MASDVSDSTGPLQRLHPSSIVFGILRQARGLLLPLLAVLFVARDTSWERWAALLIIPSAGFEIYRYATTRYRLGPADLLVRRGLVMRSERQIPLHRIQNVDLVQHPLHRLLGVAEVRVETAGGSEPEAVLRVLSLAAAEGLRAELAARQDDAPAQGGGGPSAEEPTSTGGLAGTALSGAQRAHERQPPDEPNGAPVDHRSLMRGSAARPPAEPILRIPTTELIRLGLISNRGLAIVAVGVGVAWEFNAFDRIGFETVYAWAAERPALRSPVFIAALLLGAMLLLRLLSVTWTILRFHGYELRRAGDDLRITCGLLTRVTATVPRMRIQLVSVRRTLVQRWLGRATVRIETAGGTGGDDEATAIGLQTRRWFVPIVAERDLPRVLDAVAPELSAWLAAANWKPLSPRGRRRVMKRAVVVSLLLIAAGLAAAGLTGVLWLAPVGLLIAAVGVWHAHHEARVLAHAVEPKVLMFRSGAWTRQISAVRCARIQVLRATQSPFDRRWRMATVAVDTAGAGAAEHSISIPYQSTEQAMDLLGVLVRQAEEAEPMESERFPAPEL
jgi:putative membrane protein